MSESSASAPANWETAASSWGPEEIAAIQDVIASDRYTMGPRVKEFETAFATFFGAEYGIMVNSGSSANLACIAALFFKKDKPLQRGDEIIVPAISWSTTYHPLQQYGLKLKFVDVELDSLNIDVSQLEAALTPKTRAICAVSILGNPAKMDVIRAFADAHDLYLFEDNCESMGAKIGDQFTGTFGDVNTFSSFFSHHISTMEGGMILTNDRETADLCRSLRAHGWVRDLEPDSPIFERKDEDFYEAYRFILPGYNLRPLEMSGAIGMEQLKKLPGFIETRRRNLAVFDSLFQGDDRFIVQKEYGTSSSFCFPIILNPDRNPDRAKVMAAMADANIQYRIITGGNFLRHDCMKYYDYEVVGGVAKNADLAHDYGFFVGNHPHDLEDQIRRLHKVLDAVCA